MPLDGVGTVILVHQSVPDQHMVCGQLRSVTHTTQGRPGGTSHKGLHYCEPQWLSQAGPFDSAIVVSAHSTSTRTLLLLQPVVATR